MAVPGLEDLFAVTGLELCLVDPAVLGLVVFGLVVLGLVVLGLAGLGLVVLGLAVVLAVLGLGLEGLAPPLALDGPAAGKTFLSQYFYLSIFISVFLSQYFNLSIFYITIGLQPVEGLLLLDGLTVCLIAGFGDDL